MPSLRHENATAHPSLLLIGHSHLEAFRRAFHPLPEEERPRSLPNVDATFARLGKNFTLFSTSTHAVPVREPAGWVAGADALIERLTSLAALMDGVAVIWRGNEMNIQSLFAVGEPFDVVLPSGNVPTPRHGRLLPYTALLETVATVFADGVVRRLLEAIRGVSRSTPFLLAPPPPRPDAAVRANLGREPYFVQLAERQGLDLKDAPLTPEALRVKLWQITLDGYANAARSLGLLFLSPPDDVRTPIGCLARAYQADDMTHGNALYGERYLREIVGHIR